MDDGEGVVRPAARDGEVKDERKQLAIQFKAQHALVTAFFILLFVFHALAIYLFCGGFLLSRLVLQDRSSCAIPPIALVDDYTSGSHEQGCWHPKTFDKAVIILIDALRYDFTVPFQPTSEDARPQYFHNAMPVFYETAVREPDHAFLRPFIADPPTTTLQRLKGLTTGTLPTFIDAGSNFGGEAIDEDNLIEHFYKAGKKVVHLGDNTWHSLFPGYFEPNLTRAYDSFNVLDLHTVDNGVNEHIFPLLESSKDGQWDVIIGHYLGVDHAGHRVGPNHEVMADKLQQMDGVIRKIVSKLDDKTLLVVMGDHGMDVKGDHGGESDLEVEAALWLYSKTATFGRSDTAFVKPPSTAKERPVGQIDLVPTLALLLGIPIPFNNLGQPIEEAFIGKSGHDYRNLATVSALTSAQIQQYQGKYTIARKLDESITESATQAWQKASDLWHQTATDGKASANSWKSAYEAFSAYQAENLSIFKSLWARFDLIGMSMGIAILIGTSVLIYLYAQGVSADRADLSAPLLLWGLLGTVVGGLAGVAIGSVLPLLTTQVSTFGAGLGGVGATLAGFWPVRGALRLPYPRSFWGGLCTLTTLLLCAGFAANSFTIWEDEQLLFFLTTFGVIMLMSSLGQDSEEDRTYGAINSISFLLATRLSSLSRLCREEQMPDCRSTYYASTTSSTSAGWQLTIPFIVASFLPVAIQRFYIRSMNYQGSAVIWIGIALRLGLVMTAFYWVLDAADDGNWYPNISEETLKTVRMYLAQATIALAFAAGYGTYVWASPLLLVRTEEAPAAKPEPAIKSSSLDDDDPTAPVLTTLNGSAQPQQPRSKLIILGYANTHGTRYFLLPAAWILALILLQKPMGQGTLALCIISILNVLEIIDANNLRRSPMGPILFALMGSFYFFKTGHQAVLATIQWESAFIPFKTVKYPWGPILVILNTYAAQILCAITVPAIAMWKVPPKLPGLLGRVAGAMATHVLFYAAIALATVVEAAWLRRHLMLYRVFMPRMLMGITVLLLVEIVGTLVAVGGARWSIVSVGDVFGWPEG